MVPRNSEQQAVENVRKIESADALFKWIKSFLASAENREQPDVITRAEILEQSVWTAEQLTELIPLLIERRLLLPFEGIARFHGRRVRESFVLQAAELETDLSVKSKKSVSVVVELDDGVLKCHGVFLNSKVATQAKMLLEEAESQKLFCTRTCRVYTEIKDFEAQVAPLIKINALNKLTENERRILGLSLPRTKKQNKAVEEDDYYIDLSRPE